jgi:hypothetical protein
VSVAALPREKTITLLIKVRTAEFSRVGITKPDPVVSIDRLKARLDMKLDGAGVALGVLHTLFSFPRGRY